MIKYGHYPRFGLPSPKMLKSHLAYGAAREWILFEELNILFQTSKEELFRLRV